MTQRRIGVKMRAVGKVYGKATGRLRGAMRRCSGLLACCDVFAVCVMFSGAIAVAQTNTFPSSGNVGIGTTGPSSLLSVGNNSFQVDANGAVSSATTYGQTFFLAHQLGSGYSNSLSMFTAETDNPNGTQNYYYEGQTNGTTNFSVRADGTAYFAAGIGIGDSTPSAPLAISYGNVTQNSQQFPGIFVAPASGGSYYANGSIVALGSVTNDGVFPVATVSSWLDNGGSGTTNYSGSLVISTKNMSDTGPVARVLVDPAGNVGIGTTSPGAKLEVDGNIKLTSGSGASITFPDGSVQSTAYTGVACGGDYAESVDATGDRHQYGPGDLLVLDPDHPGDVLKSAKAYSTSIAGIYSTKPGYVGRRQTGPKSPHEVPMAMVGIVPAHVTAENGPIHVGDLLVSSSIPGYAMKGTDRSRMLGAVVGKAAGNLESGKGVIEVLVTLQ
jgi:hypothetical protein